MAATEQTAPRPEVATLEQRLTKGITLLTTMEEEEKMETPAYARALSLFKQLLAEYEKLCDQL